MAAGPDPSYQSQNRFLHVHVSVFLRSVLRNTGVSKTLSLVNILYLPLSKYSVSVFRCRELGNAPSVLRSFPDVLCWSSEHYFFLAVGVFGLAFYMVRTQAPRVVCSRASTG